MDISQEAAQVKAWIKRQNETNVRRVDRVNADEIWSYIRRRWPLATPEFQEAIFDAT